MRTAQLEGLESDWESPGLGLHEITFVYPPALGERFNFKVNGKWHSTSPVQRMKRAPGKISFITKHTTYILIGDI